MTSHRSPLLNVFAPTTWPRGLWMVLLFCGPLLLHLLIVHRWSIDGDEFYTWRDSSLSLPELMKSKGQRPIYYLICHYLLQLPDAQANREVVIRLPAVLFATLIPPSLFYWLDRPGRRLQALTAAILLVGSPWLLELGQYARYYSLVLLCASLATVFFLRWLEEGTIGWLVGAIIAAVFAMISHTPAVVLFPAGVFAALAVSPQAFLQGVTTFLRRYWVPVLITSVLAAVGLAVLLYIPFITWFREKHGMHGNYSTTELVLGLVLLSGIQIWAIGWIPLLRSPSQWTVAERGLAALTVGFCVPLLLLNPFGGGVAVRYLLPAYPAIVLLAAYNLSAWMERLPSGLHQFALLSAVLAFGCPAYISNLLDGNHHDYRQAIEYVEGLDRPNPIVACSAHEIYPLYGKKYQDVPELDKIVTMNGGNMESGSYSADSLQKLMAQAESESRPLILISNEDRHSLDPPAQLWFGERFAMLASFEVPRYDYRRNRMVIYEYRPARHPDNS